MKKIILSAVMFALNVGMTTSNAEVAHGFSQQMMEQKSQLRPQQFNFFSDRYQQVQAHRNSVTTQPELASFSEQLSQQKTQLRPQEFNFFSDRYKQVNAQNLPEAATDVVSINSFQEQMQQQKKQLRNQEFNFFSDRYKQVTAHKS